MLHHFLKFHSSLIVSSRIILILLLSFYSPHYYVSITPCRLFYCILCWIQYNVAFIVPPSFRLSSIAASWTMAFVQGWFSTERRVSCILRIALSLAGALNAQQTSSAKIDLPLRDSMHFLQSHRERVNVVARRREQKTEQVGCKEMQINFLRLALHKRNSTRSQNGITSSLSISLARTESSSSTPRRAGKGFARRSAAGRSGNHRRGRLLPQIDRV